MQAADWVELVDNDNNTIRIAFSRATHLPTRKVLQTINQRTQIKSEEIEYYSNFHPIQGIQMPFQTTRDRNGLKVYQAFYRQNAITTPASPIRSSPANRSSSAGPRSAESTREKKGKYSDNGKN